MHVMMINYVHFTFDITYWSYQQQHVFMLGAYAGWGGGGGVMGFKHSPLALFSLLAGLSERLVMYEDMTIPCVLKMDTIFWGGGGK